MMSVGELWQDLKASDVSANDFWKGLKGSFSSAGEEVAKLATTGAKASEKLLKEQAILSAQSEWGRRAFDSFMAGDIAAVRALADEAEEKIRPLREKVDELDREIQQVRWGHAAPAVSVPAEVPPPPSAKHAVEASLKKEPVLPAAASIIVVEDDDVRLATTTAAAAVAIALANSTV